MTEAKLDDQTVGETSTDDDSKPTILVVEPSGVLAKVVAHICEARNVTMRRSTEVGAALDEVATRKPTAVLTALELSGLSGTSLIAALKVCPRHRGIPIGLMTSSDSRDRFRDTHAPDTIIRKGVEYSDEVEKFLTRYGIGADAETDPSLQPRKLSGKVLLAESPRSVQDQFCTQLHVAGADVVCVENGVEAVAAASEEWFDLILMDIDRPEMRCREAVGKIRSLGVTAPVIAATTEDRDIVLAEADDLGFDDVFTKPMDRIVLIDFCADYLARSAAA